MKTIEFNEMTRMAAAGELQPDKRNFPNGLVVMRKHEALRRMVRVGILVQTDDGAEYKDLQAWADDPRSCGCKKRILRRLSDGFKPKRAIFEPCHKRREEKTRKLTPTAIRDQDDIGPVIRGMMGRNEIRRRVANVEWEA